MSSNDTTAGGGGGGGGVGSFLSTVLNMARALTLSGNTQTYEAAPTNSTLAPAHTPPQMQNQSISSISNNNEDDDDADEIILEEDVDEYGPDVSQDPFEGEDDPFADEGDPFTRPSPSQRKEATPPEPELDNSTSFISASQLIEGDKVMRKAQQSTPIAKKTGTRAARSASMNTTPARGRPHRSLGGDAAPAKHNTAKIEVQLNSTPAKGRGRPKKQMEEKPEEEVEEEAQPVSPKKKETPKKKDAPKSATKGTPGRKPRRAAAAAETQSDKDESDSEEVQKVVAKNTPAKSPRGRSPAAATADKKRKRAESQADEDDKDDEEVKSPKKRAKKANSANTATRNGISFSGKLIRDADVQFFECVTMKEKEFHLGSPVYLHLSSPLTRDRANMGLGTIVELFKPHSRAEFPSDHCARIRWWYRADDVNTSAESEHPLVESVGHKLYMSFHDDVVPVESFETEFIPTIKHEAADAAHSRSASHGTGEDLYVFTHLWDHQLRKLYAVELVE